MCFLVLSMIVKNTFFLCSTLDASENHMCFLMLSMFVKITSLLCIVLDAKEN
jgi:hypothetical protein